MTETTPEYQNLLRLAQHLADAFVDGRHRPVDCELTGFSGSGRCIEPAVAVRWEMGFADLACEEHSRRAKERGALVVYPHRHDGSETPEEES